MIEQFEQIIEGNGAFNIIKKGERFILWNIEAEYEEGVFDDLQTAEKALENYAESFGGEENEYEGF